MADQPDDQRKQAGAKALTPPAQAIAAIATAPGRGGVGIVRISGSPLADFARTLVGRVPTPRRALRAQFSDASGEPIDDGLALFFPAPHSYTGEDVLELHAHGGPMVLQQLLARCIALGARLAEPGEFTRRAFLNDKLDLAQAEAVADLIDASTTAAARSALRSLRGEFSRVVRGLVDQLIELRMLVEATLDFPEEEIDPVDRFDARVRLQNITAALRRAQAQSRKGALLRSGLTAVLVGRPNVGKSSILNRLAGDDIVIVTPIPGTTRDAIRQTIQVGGIPIHVVDTAGLRETEDPVERIGIERTWEAVRGADVVLEIADAREGVAPEDKQLLSQVPDTVPRILVLNKADLRDKPIALPPGAVLMSAHTGEGVDALQQALLNVAGWQAPSEDVFMARERHLQALARAGEALDRAAAQFAYAELFAEELRLAQHELDLITGAFSADDLLGEIFTRFCIGK